MNKIITLFVLSTLILLGAGSSAAHADTQNFHFESFDADYYLSRDSDQVSVLDVKERLVAIFPDFDQNHGIIRIIPTTNQGGKNITMDPNTITIEALRNGEPEPVERAEGDYPSNRHTLYIGSDNIYVRGRQEYRLKYGFNKVITQQDGFQELYWDTNGTGFAQRFDALTVRVHLDPDSLAGWTGEAWCYVGVQGSTNQYRCEWQVLEEGVIEFVAVNALTSGENLTFVLTFADGTFVVPVPPPNSTVALITFAIGGLAAIFIIFMLFVWNRQRAKYKIWKGTFVAPEYQPIKNFTVAEACMLSASAKAQFSLPATLVELAVLGKIKLEEEQSKILKKPKWQVRVVSLDGFSASQIYALEVINYGTSVSAGDIIELKRRVMGSRNLEAAKEFYKEKTEDALKEKKLWQKSFIDSIGYTTPWIYFVANLILFALAIQAVENILDVEIVLPGMALVGFIASIVVTIWGFAMASLTQKVAQRTEQGIKTERRIEGLKTYIKLAETDRIKFHQSVKGAERIDTSDSKKMIKLYEKLLPYAIIFGLEKSWSRELEKYYTAVGDSYVPAWYVGAHAFSAVSFVSSMHSITSSVSSSTSSGADGGGYSGGGGGGGGGGGW